MLKISEINTVKEFLELRGIWNEVLKASDDNSPTLTWEHTYVSIKNLKPNQTLRIISLINDEGQTIGIAPLKLSRYKLSLLSCHIIEPLDIGNATDYTGLIFTKQEADNCLRTLTSYLLSKKDWDYLSIRDIPGNSTILSLLSSDINLPGTFTIEKGEMCPFLKIPSSIDNFLITLRKSHRRDLSRCLRNLEKDHGKVELLDYTQIGSLDNALQIFFDLHQKRWITKGETGAFASEITRQIFIDRAKLFADQGWLGLSFLTVNDNPVAVNYGLKYNKKWYCCSTGFDIEYYPYSVGNLLLLKIIEQCIKEGYTEYDFMKGYEQYKLKWTNKYRFNFNLKMVNKRPTSQLINLGLDTKKRAITYFFDKLNRNNS